MIEGYLDGDLTRADAIEKVHRDYKFSDKPCIFCGQPLAVQPFNDRKNMLKCVNWRGNCQLRDNPQGYEKKNKKQEDWME